jgi:hypothetical protein
MRLNLKHFLLSPLVIFFTISSTLGSLSQQPSAALGMNITQFIEFSDRAEDQGMSSRAGSDYLAIAVFSWQALLHANLRLEATGKKRLFCVIDYNTYVPQVLFPVVRAQFKARLFSNADFGNEIFVVELIKFLENAYPCSEKLK